jgi:hypothetical protein
LLSQFAARLLNFHAQIQEGIMFLLTVLVIATAVVVCLALAASSSPVYGFNAKAELDAKSEFGDLERPTSKPKAFATTHQGVAMESQPVVSAAGMQ